MRNIQIDVYPNPVFNTLKVEIEEKAPLQIYTLEGRLLIEVEINKKPDIDVSQIQPGIYILPVILREI